MSFNSEKMKKLQLFAVISLFLFSGLLLFNNPGITGHFSADFRSHNLDIEMYKSQSYMLKTGSQDPIYISSLRLSGRVIGDGMVEIYLEEDGRKIYLYRNTKFKEEGLPQVTGLSILPSVSAAEEAGHEETPVFLILSQTKTLEWDGGFEIAEDQELDHGPFSNKCIDTCFVEMPVSANEGYNLVFMIEPGTKLEIDKIIYTLKDEHIS